MNGIIIVNKEKGMTSHDVVNHIRKIFKTKKVGHLGTLDPDATGVLAICLNEATKLVQFLENDKKKYLTEILIGRSTDTYDSTGTIIKEQKVEKINESEVDNVLQSLLGDSIQIPPIYSAIKIKGKKLYQYARNGIEIEIPARKITITHIKRVSPIIYHNDKTLTFRFEVEVSKGTYIRTLCKDIAEKLGFPGLMNNLIRVQSGMFSIMNSFTITEISNGNYQLISMEDALANYPIINDPSYSDKIINGMKLQPYQVYNVLNNYPNQVVFTFRGNLKAIYHYSQENQYYKAVRVWK